MKHVLDALCGARFPSMNVLLFGKVGAWMLVIIGLVLMPQLLYADYCLKTKPPRGMPKRCHSLKITVPQGKSQLYEKIVDWMTTCVMKSRARSLVTNSSIEPVWQQIGSHRGKKYTLTPNYTPFTFKNNGNKCYGIEKLTFSVAKHKSGGANGGGKKHPDPANKNEMPAEEQAQNFESIVFSYHRALEDMILREGDRRRLNCYLSRLNKPRVDDRVIQWPAICSYPPMALGKNCPVSVLHVDTRDLKKYISNKEDVERANKKLHFMTNMKTVLKNGVIQGKTVRPDNVYQYGLEKIIKTQRNVFEATEFLEEWSTIASGGGSGIPKYYLAIKEWINKQQKNPSSLYSCF